MSKKPRLGSGKRFAALEGKVEKEGYSKESAKAIAASAGRKKYGAEKMGELASKGRERAAKKKV
jgi:hypothetical protein